MLKEKNYYIVSIIFLLTANIFYLYSQGILHRNMVMDSGIIQKMKLINEKSKSFVNYSIVAACIGLVVWIISIRRKEKGVWQSIPAILILFYLLILFCICAV